MMRQLATASLAVLLCWSAVGCGGVRTEDAFNTAVENLTKAKTAKVAFSFDPPSVGTERGTLRARFGTQTDMVIHYDVFEAPPPPQPSDPPIVGEPTPQAPATRLTDVVILGSTVYVKGSGVASKGKQWGTSDRASNTFAETGADLLDPLTYLQMAAKAKHITPEKNASNIGDHPGTPYTLYCGLQNQDCDIHALGSLGELYPDTETITISTWLDGDERPAFIAVTGNLYNKSAPGGSAAFGYLDIEMSLSDFGSPVTITPPPPQQVG